MRTFALALLVGIVSGTYSSIFNASQIISLWQEIEDRFRRRGGRPPAGARAAA
jgi:preprotein translocase subunit SecF